MQKFVEGSGPLEELVVGARLPGRVNAHEVASSLVFTQGFVDHVSAL